MFLIYINDLLNSLESIAKLFADDSSLFSTIHEQMLAASQFDDNFKKISNWAQKWKMIFNTHLSRSHLLKKN